MKKPKLNHFHWILITVAVGIATVTLLIVAIIYKNEIDQSFTDILNN